MKRAIVLAAMAGAAILAALAPGPAGGAGPDYVEEQVSLPGFGRCTVYRPEPVQRARGVVLFLSGDGGWNLGVVDMARRTAARAIVVGLSMPAWRRSAEKQAPRCWFPAGDLESTAQRIEKIYRLPRYLAPILVGYSSGATAVYGALAQAPGGAFGGAISLGFCPDLAVARPLCPRDGWRPDYDSRKKVSLLPICPTLAPRGDGVPRWTVLQGEIDKVCEPRATERFAAQVPGTRVVALQGVGHGFSVPRRWGAAYDEAIEALLEPAGAWANPPADDRPGISEQAPPEVRRRLESLDLPLEVEWPEGARDAIVFVSGDGGWAELDRRVAAGLAARGIAVVGWNALRYFWERKSPERFRSDLARVTAALAGTGRVFAGGYSFGAEVVPVAGAEALTGDSAPAPPVAGYVLLGPGSYAEFEISPLDWIRSREPHTAHPVRQAIQAAAELVPVLCIESSGAEGSGCPASGRLLLRESLPGGHHFAGDFETLAGRIADFIKRTGPSD